MTRTVEQLARAYFPLFARIIELDDNIDFGTGTVNWSFVDADFTFNTVGDAEVEAVYDELFARLCEMAIEHESLPYAKEQ